MASDFTVLTQPGVTSLDNQGPPGTVPLNDVTVRCLQDTQEDAEVAGRLLIEGFRGKVVFTVSEQK